MSLKTLQIVGDSSYGGASYLVLRWCEYLCERGCEVDVVATDPMFVDELRKNRDVRILDSIVIPRDVSLRRDVRAFIQLLGLLCQGRYSVVHTYTSTPGFLGRIAARLSGVPVIVHHQAGWAVNGCSSLQRLIYKSLEYLAVLASTKSICVSDAVAEQARRLRLAPSSRLVTVRNGIDPRPFVEATASDVVDTLEGGIGVRGGDVSIGNMGRLAPQKDNDTLIRSLVCLKTLVPQVPFSLVLAGDGPSRRTLEDQARLLGICEQVRFLGFVRDIPSFMGMVDIFVNTSLWEGLSISLLEAMAAAKPIVATSIPANAELIEHEVTGLLVPPRSPVAVARAIARFVNEPGLARKCALSARERLVEHYTIDKMLRETWRVYLNLLQAAMPGIGVNHEFL